MGESIPWNRKIRSAVWLTILNMMTWVVVPYALYRLLASLPSADTPSIGVYSLTFIYTFGAIITGLQVLGALTEGMAISVSFLSGSHVASAYYIYTAVSGGTLALETAGVRISLQFQTLLFLLMLPSMFNSIKEPIVFLLERSEAARESPESV